MDVTRTRMSSSLLLPFLPANALNRCGVGPLRRCRARVGLSTAEACDRIRK
jgi:hypothetical protein